MQSTTLIAFDQHAATTVAAVLSPSQRTPALRSMTSDTATIVRIVERLRRQSAVRRCYEAGPCGFELQRALTAHDVPCDVIAPALIPRRAGDRMKTDRRDAAQLALLYRAGALTPIHIPTDQEEAARDLRRCREDTRADLLRARHRLSKFSCGMVVDLPARRRRGRRRTTPGRGRSGGHCWHSNRSTPRTCARWMKRGPASGASKLICAACWISSRWGRVSNACGASAAWTDASGASMRPR
jgi:transposase